MDPTVISPLQRVRKETWMSDHFPGKPGQDDAALAPELAQLDELLLAEGRRWRRHEPSTARLERHLRALVRTDGAGQRNEDVMLSEREPTYDTPTPGPDQRRSPSRWRSPLAAVATVLLVAMAASVFAFMSAKGVGTGNGQHSAKATPTRGFTRVTAIQPRDTHLPIPANVYLWDISFSSARDGWAVGGNRIIHAPPSQDFSAAQGVLVHYHDGVWTTPSERFPGIQLNSVSMISADDGWAVGWSLLPYNAATFGSGAAVLLHYTGGHWVNVDAPALANTHPSKIRMLSPDFGYIVGVVNSPSTTDAGVPAQHLGLVVYQNGAWKAIRTPFAATSQVVMVSASEGWALTVEHLTKPGGLQDYRTTVYHYLNGIWTKSLTFPGVITQLSAASPADVWAIAFQCSNCEQAPTIRIEHYNGATWEPVSPPSQSEFLKIPGFASDGFPGLQILDEAAGGVWIACTAQDTVNHHTYTISTGMWVYGLNGNDHWLSVSPPATSGGVLSLTTDGAGGTWAVAQNENPFEIFILYSQGQDWKVYGRS